MSHSLRHQFYSRIFHYKVDYLALESWSWTSKSILNEEKGDVSAKIEKWLHFSLIQRHHERHILNNPFLSFSHLLHKKFIARSNSAYQRISLLQLYIQVYYKFSLNFSKFKTHVRQLCRPFVQQHISKNSSSFLVLRIQFHETNLNWRKFRSCESR